MMKSNMTPINDQISIPSSSYV